MKIHDNMRIIVFTLLLLSSIILCGSNSEADQTSRLSSGENHDRDSEINTNRSSHSNNERWAENNNQPTTGSQIRPPTSSSRPFGNNKWSQGSSNSRPFESGSSNRRTTERPGEGEEDGRDRNWRPSTSSSSSSSNRRPSGGGNREQETTPEPEEKGLITTVLGKVKNATSIGQAIFSGDKGLIKNTIKTFLTTVDSCIGSKERGWTDPELGDFTIGKDSPYCNKQCLRNFFCCAPMRPEEIDVKFIFSDSKQEHNLLYLNDPNARRFLNRQRDKKIVWIIHGLLNHVYIEPIFNQTRDAYIDRGFNVIVVDWNKGNRLYMQAMANVRIVGALTGQLMDHYGLEERSICAGFSLGSHICGEAGAFLKRKGKTLYKCHGIDPAGPGFDGCSRDIRLDRTDCGIVTSIHTSQFTSVNSLLGEEGLGTKVKTGHCDFWPNDGKDQPRCDNTTITGFGKWLFSGKLGKLGQEFEHAMACSHWRGMNYYLSQVRKICHFVGKEGACGGGIACTRDNMTDVSGRSGGQNESGTRSKRMIQDFGARGRDSSTGRNRRPGSDGQNGNDRFGVGDGSFGAGSGEEFVSGSNFGSGGDRRPGSGFGSGGNRRPGNGFGSQESGADRRPGGGSGFESGGGRRPGTSGGGFGSHESGGATPGHGSGFGIDNENGFGSSGSGEGIPGHGSGFGSGGDRRPGSWSGSSGNGGRPGQGQGFGSGGDGRPGHESGFGSGGDRRPGSGSEFGSSGNGDRRPGQGSGFGSGGRPSGASGSQGNGDRRPGHETSFGEDSEISSGSSNHRPGSGSRPGTGSGWGSSGDRRPGQESGIGSDGDSDNGFGSGSSNHRPGSGSRPGGGSGGDRRPGGLNGDRRPGSTGSGSGNNRPGTGSEPFNGDDSSGDVDESAGSSSGNPNGNRPGQSGNRPNQGSGWGNSGGGGRPSPGSGGGRPSMGNHNSGSDQLRIDMPLSPDDVCDPRYDFDYRFATTGREPFC